MIATCHLRSVVLASAILSLAGPALAASPRDVDDCVQQDDQERRIAGCTRIIEDAQQSVSERADAYTARGNAHMNRQDYDRATADYDEAIRLEPSPTRHQNRGAAYHSKGEFDRAVAEFGEAIKLDANFAIAHRSRCWSRILANRDLPQAAADCSEALRLEPDNLGTFDRRALAYLKLGRFTEAIADFDAALRADPRKAYSLYGRGYAKAKQGDPVAGVADMAAAEQIRADIAEVFARLGVK